MSLQYLPDALGKQNAVVIPINEWEGIVRQHKELKSLEDQSEGQELSPKKYNMAEFAGSLSKEASEALQQYVRHGRPHRIGWRTLFASTRLAGGRHLVVPGRDKASAQAGFNDLTMVYV